MSAFASARHCCCRPQGGAFGVACGQRRSIVLSARPAVSRRQLWIQAKSALAEPAALSVKSIDGSDVGSAELRLKVAGQDTAKALVHRYLVYVQQNARRGTASTLTRAEVRGGGRKPYKQKGTGNARRGSNTSPLFPGGGIVFGPKPKDWSISMNKKERRLALATALQSAAADITVVDSFSDFAEPRTKYMVDTLTKLWIDVSTQKTLIIASDIPTNMQLAGRNLQKLFFNTASALRVFDILNAQNIIIEKAALEDINTRYGLLQTQQDS